MESGLIPPQHTLKENRNPEPTVPVAWLTESLKFDIGIYFLCPIPGFSKVIV